MCDESAKWKQTYSGRSIAAKKQKYTYVCKPSWNWSKADRGGATDEVWTYVI